MHRENDQNTIKKQTKTTIRIITNHTTHHLDSFYSFKSFVCSVNLPEFVDELFYFILF